MAARQVQARGDAPLVKLAGWCLQQRGSAPRMTRRDLAHSRQPPERSIVDSPRGDRRCGRTGDLAFEGQRRPLEAVQRQPLVVQDVDDARMLESAGEIGEFAVDAEGLRRLLDVTRRQDENRGVGRAIAGVFDGPVMLVLLLPIRDLGRAFLWQQDRKRGRVPGHWLAVALLEQWTVR